MSTATKVKQRGKTSPYRQARSGKSSKYARARVKAGLTMRDLTAQGFGMATVSLADSGKLPKHPAIRASYLRAIKCTAAS